LREIKLFGVTQKHGWATESEVFRATKTTEEAMPWYKEILEKGTAVPFKYRGGINWKEGDPQSYMAVAGEKLYDLVEKMNRGGYYIALRRKGYSPAQAKHLVDVNQFDYQAVSPFTKTVLRRASLFPTWTIKNIPYQFVKLFERPGGGSAQMIRGMNQMLGEDQGRSEYAPSWIREGVGIRTGGPPEATNYLRSLGLPVEDINKIPMGKDGIDKRRFGEKLLSNLSPPILSAVEPIFQKQFFTGRKYKDLWSPTKEATGKQIYPLDLVANYTPLSRFLHEWQTIVDPRKSILEKAANLATGVRTTTVDLPKWKAIDLKRAQEQEVQKEEGIYEFPSYGVKSEYKGTPEGVRLKKVVRQLLAASKEESKIKKQRESEEKAKLMQVGG
jgi:hypothetical protein